MSQRTDGSGLWLDCRDAMLLSRLLIEGRSRATRDGWRFSTADNSTLQSIDLLARAHRASIATATGGVSDVVGPIGPDISGPSLTMVEVNTAKAAERLDRSTRHVRQLIDKGDLAAHPDPCNRKRKLIYLDDLEALIKRRTA